MANAKKKNNVKITSVKSNNAILKKGVKTTVVNGKKPRQVKKKLDINDEVVVEKKNSGNLDTKINKSVPEKVIKPNVTSEVKTDNKLNTKSSTLTQEDIVARRKERNRKKYQNQQKKYRENRYKKKVIVDDKVFVQTEEKEESRVLEDTIREIPLEEDLLKKTTEIDVIKSSEKGKELERKEKRKTNRKTTGFTQTLSNIKEISVNKINDVREKTNDDTIPVGKTFIEKSKRSKRLIKEAIAYAILLTIINVICIIVFDYFNFLRLFDVKALNVIVTILISLTFNFFVSFMVDYFVTNVWLTKKRKKKDGEQDGNSRSFKGEYQENIKDKEGK